MSRGPYKLTLKQQQLVGERLGAVGVAQQHLQATVEGIMAGIGLDRNKDWDFDQAAMTLTLRKKEE